MGLFAREKGGTQSPKVAPAPQPTPAAEPAAKPASEADQEEDVQDVPEAGECDDGSSGAGEGEGDGGAQELTSFQKGVKTAKSLDDRASKVAGRALATAETGLRLLSDEQNVVVDVLKAGAEKAWDKLGTTRVGGVAKKGVDAVSAANEKVNSAAKKVDDAADGLNKRMDAIDQGMDTAEQLVDQLEAVDEAGSIIENYEKVFEGLSEMDMEKIGDEVVKRLLGDERYATYQKVKGTAKRATGMAGRCELLYRKLATFFKCGKQAASAASNAGGTAASAGGAAA